MRHGKLDRLSVAVFADTDSRWKWGAAMARTLEPAALSLFLKNGPAAPTDRQLTEAGVDPDQTVSTSIAGFPQLLAQADCEVVILALPGDACQATMHALAAQWQGPRRPIVVTGYVGVVYERVIEGLLNRAGCDILLANSPADTTTFRRVFQQYDLDPATVVATSLPFLSEGGPSRTDTTVATTITFASQPGVPSRLADRKYLVDRLVQHAEKFPERQVLLKPRGGAREQLTHPEPYPFQKILGRRRGPLPPNFSVVTGAMSQVLDRTDLLVTVSSTAAIEAMHRNIATAILTDFGVREELGNPYFSGSGCLVSFDDLDAAALPVLDSEWAAAHGLMTTDSSGFRDRISELRDLELEPLHPFYNLTRSPAYLPKLLAGHGLTPQGTPLAGGARRGLFGRLVRSLAHSLYRQGVGVVAPILRRLGAS